MSNKFIIITYLIYIIFWEALVVGGTAYAVFILNKSGWWFILGIYLSYSAYSPPRWHSLLTGIDIKQKES